MHKAKVIFILLSFIFMWPAFTEAQQQWMVYLKDKQHNDFNPYTYFDSKAIERRLNSGLVLDDPTDWPVNEAYVNQITPLVTEVVMISRWFNAVAVEADATQILNVRSLPFVLDIEWVEPLILRVASYTDYDTSINAGQADVLRGQINTLGAETWRNAGINGKGMRIAIFDVGFLNADHVPAFDDIRNNKRLIATHDFTNRKKSDYVFYDNAHGTEVWSCIAGKIGETQIGLATGAEFLLAKTEKDSEKFAEELNWLAAAEWADKNGADIINSSLGYTGKRYFSWQMDGKTSFVTRAANMAARKGMLVVNAAGNEGTDAWHTIGAPADADSVLSVGGIDPETGYHTGFSSYGPTSDKRMKPNVAAYGHVTAAAPSGLTSTQGTSFSSPLVAGFAACAWQTNRSLTNMQLFSEIEKSGNLYPYFDYAHGFGIPQVDHFLTHDKKTSQPTFRIVENGDSITVFVNKTFTVNDANPGEPGYKNQLQDGAEQREMNDFFYYNIMNKAGIIDSYYVLDVSQQEVLTVLKSNYRGDETLNLHFAGYSMSVKL